MAAAQVFRQAIQARCPCLSSLLGAPPSALRPLSSIATAQLAEPSQEPPDDLEDAGFPHSGQRRAGLEHPLPGDNEQRDQERSSASRSFGGTAGGLSDERWGGVPSTSGQSFGGAAAPRDPGGDLETPSRLPEQLTDLKSVYQKFAKPEIDPDYFAEKPGKVLERFRDPNALPRQTWVRDGQSAPFLKRSEIDPNFQHALPTEVNQYVESIIKHMTIIEQSEVEEHLTKNLGRLNARLMFFVIMRLARRGYGWRAYDVLHWYRRQDFYEADPTLYHICIYALQEDEADLGWRFFRALASDGCGTSVVAYIKLLRYTSLSNAFWRTFQMLEDMRRHVPNRPDVRDFNNLLGNFMRLRRPIPCEKVFLKMNASEGHFGLEPDIVSYNTLMSCYAREGHYRKVEALLAQMQRAQIEPDAYTCSTVVQAYGNANLFVRATRAFEDMRAAGYRPNSIVYNSLLTTLAKAMIPKYADKVIKKVEQYAKMMKADGYEPDTSTKKALVLAYSKAGLFDKSEEIIAEIQARGESVRPLLWHAYITGFAEMGRVEETIATIQRFIADGYVAGFVVRNAVLMAYAKAGDVAQVEEELRFMRDDGVELMQSASNAVLQAYGQAGQTHKIEPFFKMMEECGVPPSTVTYKVLIEAYGNAGQFDMVDDLMQSIREFQHVKLLAFNQLVKTYAQANMIEKMEEAFQIIKYRNFRPGKVIVEEMALAYERAGMTARAAQFNELLRLVQAQRVDDFEFLQEGMEEESQAEDDGKDGQAESSEHRDAAG